MLERARSGTMMRILGRFISLSHRGRRVLILVVLFLFSGAKVYAFTGEVVEVPSGDTIEIEIMENPAIPLVRDRLSDEGPAI